MKTIKKYKYILFLFVITFVISCENNDTSTPEIVITEQNIENEISLDKFISNTLFKEGVNQGLFDLDANPSPTEEQITAVNTIIMTQIQSGNLTINLVGNDNVSGYVISSDREGNFFEELIIQDKPENPTIGVRVMLNENPLYISYEIGRKIYIKIDGLFLGINNGVLSIGGETEVDGGGETEVTKINSNLISSVIQRSTEVANIVPKEVILADLNDDSNENIFLSIKNMQFLITSFYNGIPDSFASEIGDRFNGDVFIESCIEDSRTVISTGSFASFKSQNLPSGNGEINVILARDFFNDKYILKINNLSDIKFEDNIQDRCGFDFITCNTTTPLSGNTIIYQEDFQNFNGYSTENWVNINVSDGSTEWIEGDFQGNNYAQITGNNTNEDIIDTWLVTPTINLDNSTNEEFHFDIQTNYDNGRVLAVLISNDFINDVATANWQVLNIIVPRGPSNSFGNGFTKMPNTDISCYDGNINIAFLYQGADPGANTRYHIDNIEITGN